MAAASTLVLASTSPYRRVLLERLGLPFSVRAPICDEDAFKDGRLESKELAELLAFEKAKSVALGDPQSHVIGSDQVVDLAGEILGKPGSAHAAAQQLARLSGREHRLITAVALVCPDGEVARYTDVTRLRMRSLSEQEIARYVAHDQPFDCAGSYKIECLGIALFEHIECADYSAISGLPLLSVAALLRQQGFAVP